MLKYITVEGENSPLYPDVRAIYESSFPVEEQRGLLLQRAAWSDEGYELLAIVQGESVIGLLGVWHLEEGVFLEHLAMAKEVRGKGIGSRLLGDYLATIGEATVILEVDPPCDEISRRRVCFYERLGFFLTDHDHVQLPFRKEDGPLTLRIMSYPHPISKEQYEAFNKEYLGRVMNFSL